MTVLIVDDHPSFRASARLLLETEGYDVVGEAGDGAAALRAVAELAPQLVLLDVHLPDADGFELAAQIASGAHAPQVVLTSSRELSDYGPLLDRSGAAGFVGKGELSCDALAGLLRG